MFYSPYNFIYLIGRITSRFTPSRWHCCHSFISRYNSSFYKRNPVLITQQNEQLYAVLGIPLSTPIGKLTLTTNTKPIEIEIISYPYAEQRLTVVNQDYVNPNQDQLDRYAREAKEQNDVYSSFSNNNWTHFPNFIRPTAGKFSNSFGRKRFFNGEERAPHSGLDIPAPIGQKVIAPANGIVVQTGNYFLMAILYSLIMVKV